MRLPGDENRAISDAAITGAGMPCRDRLKRPALHPAGAKPGALRNGAPFADMPQAQPRLCCGLLRRSGGDRVMAQVLALVPTAGLEAVLAAELALESGLNSRPCACTAWLGAWSDLVEQGTNA